MYEYFTSDVSNGVCKGLFKIKINARVERFLKSYTGYQLPSTFNGL